KNRGKIGVPACCARGNDNCDVSVSRVYARKGDSPVRRAFSVRRTIYDMSLSIGALSVLLLALVIVDDRVRDQLSPRISSARAASQLISAGTTVQNLLTVVADVARQQSLEHAPLMLFVFAGSVLVLFMIRT